MKEDLYDGLCNICVCSGATGRDVGGRCNPAAEVGVLGGCVSFWPVVSSMLDIFSAATSSACKTSLVCRLEGKLCCCRFSLSSVSFVAVRGCSTWSTVVVITVVREVLVSAISVLGTVYEQC